MLLTDEEGQRLRCFGAGLYLLGVGDIVHDDRQSLFLSPDGFLHLQYGGLSLCWRFNANVLQRCGGDPIYQVYCYGNVLLGSHYNLPVYQSSWQRPTVTCDGVGINYTDNGPWWGIIRQMMAEYQPRFDARRKAERQAVDDALAGALAQRQADLARVAKVIDSRWGNGDAARD